MTQAHPQTAFSNTAFPKTSFISRRREIVYQNTLLYQLDVLKSTGRYDAFKLQWHPSYNDEPSVWPVPNHLFWDSDVAKWIEGACYFLLWKHSETIDGAVRELVDMIRSAQQPDGYLNIHFTVVAPDKRFMYNAGHLIEAALAHNKHYGTDDLMEPILKYVDLLHKTFGPGPEQRHGYPGHPEIELALLRLFERTRDPRHLDLARYFIDERGNPTGQGGRHYFDVEAEERGESPHDRLPYWPAERPYQYYQAHVPIVDQPTIEGHSVRAMYLLTAVADLVRLEGQGLKNNKPKRDALERLWSNMVDNKMYLTGGIGAHKQWEGFGMKIISLSVTLWSDCAHKQWEGFGIDYFLPSGTDEGGCYAETCAGIGVMMLAERLLQLDLDGKVADIMELCFYNAVMTGMSADGKRFTYVNQLASTDADLSQRAEWFTCACCPPNVTRLFGYVGGYLWTSKVDDTRLSVNVHMYSSATLSVDVGGATVEIEQVSNWPWEGKMEFAVKNASDVPTTINLRIPGWATGWKISPELPSPQVVKGYLMLPADWLRDNPSFTLDIPLKPRFVSPHPYTNQDIIALARGPLVYCLEDVDNPWVNDHFKSLVFDPKAAISESEASIAGTGEPYIALTGQNFASFLGVDTSLAPQLPRESITQESDGKVDKLNFVPYALRDNRGGKGHMRVGMRRQT
ncbi:hypothetical protein V498_04458 [Pseudogymnoascus sp. VKM F-4517 (FW-2822)]|nr:hypothetical protein V498_04458 [Pseudogymnoascus sp. VKM F-4517 (FW-2822)]